MVSNIMSEVHHDCYVEALGLTVRLGVICNRRQLCSVQTDSDCPEELGLELSSVFSQQLDWNINRDDLITTKMVVAFVEGYCEDCYGPGKFCVSVFQNSYVFLAKHYLE